MCGILMFLLLAWYLCISAQLLCLPQRIQIQVLGSATPHSAWADYKYPKNIAPQVMMATTNGTLFNTVGIGVFRGVQ